jgi:acyl-CoA thioesterase
VTSTSEFDAAQALSGNGPVFGAVLDGQWDGIGITNGGFLLALATRAIGQLVAFPDPIAVSGFYLRPGVPGPVEISAEVLRSGKTTAFGQASVSRDGKELLRASAAFSDLGAAAGRGGLSYDGSEPPDQPPPGQCLELKRATFPPITLVNHLEYRCAKLPFWAAGGAPSGRPVYEGWMRFVDGREPDLLSLLMFVDAVAPAVLEVGAGTMSTVELTVHLRGRPAPGWVAFRTQTRYVADGYLEEDAEIWDSGGRLVAQSRQLGIVLR